MEWSAGFGVFRGLHISWLTLIGIYLFVDLVGALSIIEQPKSKGVEEGRSFTLKCIVESTNQPYVIWYKQESPGSNVPLSSYRQIRREAPEWERLSIVGAGNAFNLRVVDARSVDQSSYQCVAYSRGSSVRSNIAKITILAVGDSVNCHLYPQHVDIGATLNYTCRAPQSLPGATLTWWKGTEPISSVQKLPDGSLRLRHVVTAYDNYVRFTCTVGLDINQAYGLNCSTVPLHLPLNGNLNPARNTVSIGSNAAFRCSAVAAPPVNKIKWLVGYGSQAKISKTSGRFEVKNEPHDASMSTLIIKNIAAVDNGTVVRCVLMNEIKQKDIAMAYVIVTPLDPTAARRTTPRRPRITSRPAARTTVRTRNTLTRAPRTTQKLFRTTKPPTAAERATTLTTKVLTRLYQPRLKDVEISVHDGIPTKDVVPSLDNNGNDEEGTGDSSPSSNSSLVPTVATLCVLLVLLIAAGGIVYVVVFRRKMINKNNFLGGVKYRQSYNNTTAAGGGTTAEDRAATRMSLRLQTIEVVVNQPPPEWQSKLKDVKPVGNDYTDFENKTKDVPSSPPPAYTPKPTETKIIPSQTGQNGEKQNCANEDQEDDAIYALPAKKSSTLKRDNDNVNRDNHQNAKRQISDAKKRLLSLDYNDDDDPDIEWDQSSWDNSSFEDEIETVERIQEGQMYSGPAGDQIYANTQEKGISDDFDDYGPEYGNLPNLRVDETDPTYSRVASLKE